MKTFRGAARVEANSRLPEKPSCRCEVVAPSAAQKHPRWSSLRDPRKLFRWTVNSFRAPRVLSRAQDISSRRYELNSRRREFLRNHRNSLRSAPKELPKPSSLLLVTVYQFGKLHPPMGNIGKRFIDTGNSVAAPGSASQRREFVHGLSAPPRRPRSLFAAPGSAFQTIGAGFEPLCVPTRRWVFAPRVPKPLPAHPNSFSALRARTQERRARNETKGSRSQRSVFLPTPSLSLRRHGHFAKGAASSLGDTRSFYGDLRRALPVRANELGARVVRLEAGRSASQSLVVALEGYGNVGLAAAGTWVERQKRNPRCVRPLARRPGAEHQPPPRTLPRTRAECRALSLHAR